MISANYLKFTLLFNLVILQLFGIEFKTIAQCSINANPSAFYIGNITPDTIWQLTNCITGGDYFTFTAVAGQQYNFTFCSNGGTAGWDTEISINNAFNTGVTGAYNDDFCGIASQLSWTATAAGTFAVYITGFGCANNANCATLAYQMVNPPPPPINLVVQTGGNNSNAPWLVQNIFLSGCSQVSGVNFTGNGQGIGYFTNGASIGIQEGIIISSGAVTNAEGPNNQSGVTTAFGTPGDANLTTLTSFNPCGPPSATFDASVLTFTFVPLTSSVQFQYVFASEEYDEWVCSSFDDVFGFFISGPGIAGQQNIALVPGAGNTYVGVNTVNLTNNSAYYNQNPTGSIMTQYDGYTDVMTAIATGLTPCQTYTIKLAVADAGDSVLDSAVFLAANSFNAGTAVSVSSFVPSSGTQDAYEGCQDGYFQFTRGDITDLSAPVTLSLIITGTATPGTDYQTLPITVTIPAGQISYQLPVIAYADLLSEGSESIIVQVIELQCNCTYPPPVQLNIFDSTAPFSAFINSPPTICQGEQALLAVIASGSTYTPYTYLWSNGISAPAVFVTPTVTTSYSVTVTDDCGRSTNAVVQVVVNNPPPNVFVAPAGPFCSNAPSVLLSASVGGGTWSGPGVTPSTGIFNPTIAASNGAGPYTIIYTLSNSCGSSIDSTQIVVNTIQAPVIIPQSICLGTSAILNAGSGYSSYIWSGGAGSTQFVTVNPANSSNYSVTVTNAQGCTSTASTTVNVFPLPNVLASSNSPVCVGSNIALTSTPAGGSGTYNTFVWSGPTGSGFASLLQNPVPFTANAANAGPYSVTVTDTNGCTASDNAVVTVNPLPTANAGVDKTICTGQSTNLTATGGGTYFWSTGATTATISVSPDSTTTYTVTVTSAGGCAASDNTVVTVNPLPTANAGVDKTICTGQSTNLTATGGGTYLWSTGATTATISVSPDSTTTYTVTVTSAGGCAASDNTVVSVNPLPTANAGVDKTICAGQSTNLTATGGGTYLWSTGATTATISVYPDSTTTYTVTVTSAGGCAASDNVSVTVNQATTPTITGPNTVCTAQSITLSGSPTGGTWQSSNPAVATVNTSGIVTALATGEAIISYTITQNDCTASASITVTIHPIPFVGNFNAPSAVCAGDSIQLSNATPNGVWNSSETSVATINSNGVVSGISAGETTISYTVTNSFGCSNTASKLVTVHALPVISISPADTVICPGGSPILSASGGELYEWSNGMNGGNIMVSPSETQNYTVTVTDSNGCMDTGATVVTINQDFGISINGSAGIEPNIACLNDTEYIVSFFINGGTPPYWIDETLLAGNYFESSIQNSPTFSFTVSDLTGCTFSATGNNAPCLMDCTVIAEFNTLNNLNCSTGFEVNVVSGPPQPPVYQFSLNNGPFQTYSQFTNLEPGTYAVAIQTGCGQQNLGVYVHDPLTVQVQVIPAGSVFYGNATISGGTSPYSILWSTGATGTSANLGALPGIATVVVTDGNGCVKLINLTQNGAVGIAQPPNDLTGSFTLFPNPAYGFFALAAAQPLPQPADLFLYAPIGQLIAQRRSRFEQPELFDTSLLPAGVYWLALYYNNQQQFFKVVVHGSR